METKILIVDDNKVARMLVVEAFAEYACTVVEAGDGLEGLAIATREKPDLILLDMAMPIMDGGEMLAKLKSNSDLKAIPVIMLTGGVTREDVIKLAKLGVRDCLLKPFTPEVIIERVSRILELHSKGAVKGEARRFDDELRIMVVDDKPAIIEQVRMALASTPWVVEGVNQPQQALVVAKERPPDAVLISLSLPNDGGFSIFKMLNSSLKTRNVPFFALTVKTAVNDHARAQQSGFAGIMTKPLDPEDVKTRIARALNLDISYKYFEQRDDMLLLRLPGNFNGAMANEITHYLSGKLTATVDAGLDKLIVDLSQIQTADVTLIKLVLSVLQLSQELSIRSCIIGSQSVAAEAKHYEETKDWPLTASMEEAVATLNGNGNALAV